MKFRMVDRILSISEDRIETRKTVSFEEFSLLKPWGRKGAFPETLILQVAVETASLLISHRTERKKVGVLEEVEALRFEAPTKPGEILHCRIQAEDGVYAFRTDGLRSPVASGRLRLKEVPLTACVDPVAFDLQWEALHGAP